MLAGALTEGCTVEAGGTCVPVDAAGGWLVPGAEEEGAAEEGTGAVLAGGFPPGRKVKLGTEDVGGTPVLGGTEIGGRLLLGGTVAGGTVVAGTVVGGGVGRGRGSVGI